MNGWKVSRSGPLLPIRMNRQLRPSLVVGLALVVVVVTACGSPGGAENTGSSLVEVEDLAASTTVRTEESGSGELVVPECDDNASRAAGFVLNEVFYALSCAAVRDSMVTEDVIGVGDLYGDSVTVNLVEGVADSVLVAVSVPGGFYSDNDPDERHTSWSVAFPEGADQAAFTQAICEVADLSASQRLTNGCHLDEGLVTCELGPGFPEEVLDDLSLYPVPTDFFGADVAALVGTDDPQDLVGWHVIVEEQTSDGTYVQLLLREHPETGELQYLLDGHEETFDDPRPCTPEPAD